MNRMVMYIQTIKHTYLSRVVCANCMIMSRLAIEITGIVKSSWVRSEDCRNKAL